MANEVRHFIHSKLQIAASLNRFTVAWFFVSVFKIYFERERACAWWSRGLRESEVDSADRGA